ncbi:hypothetical protein E4U39_006997 [Claviceps sp. Clav50 group G5]|nr:hypothetical protein E4U39_006997 [Claviceps sp. Clav50 group G5]
MSPGTRSASATILKLDSLGVENFWSSTSMICAAADSKVGGDGCLQLEDGHATAILLPKMNQYRDKDHEDYDDQNGEFFPNIW